MGIFANSTERLCNTCGGKLWDDERETCRRCKGDKHPADTFIRRAGFRIHSRAGRHQAMWELEGHIYSHADALMLAQKRNGVFWTR